MSNTATAECHCSIALAERIRYETIASIHVSTILFSDAGKWEADRCATSGSITISHHIIWVVKTIRRFALAFSPGIANHQSTTSSALLIIYDSIHPYSI
jgi:hypothetical protein